MAETEEQQSLLHQIEQATATMQLYQTKVKDSRSKLWDLVVAAKDLHTSSYAISRAAGISQPRVMQIVKEVRDAHQSPESTPESLGPLVEVNDGAADSPGPGSSVQLGE